MLDIHPDHRELHLVDDRGDGRACTWGPFPRANFEVMLKDPKQKNGFAMAYATNLLFMNGRLVEMKG